MAKLPRQLQASLLHQLPIPQRPWSHIAVDFITNLPHSRGNTTILSVIDLLLQVMPVFPSALVAHHSGNIKPLSNVGRGKTPAIS